jgi:CheY-like chemotaxis protein
LIIEDNPADVFLLRHALNQQPEPFVLEVLRDGEEAIQFVERSRIADEEPEPCVIVLDLHLPKHDGKSVLKAIRKEATLSTVRVVALTTLATPEDENQIRELGVRLYSNKPNDLEAWLELAARLIEICKEPEPVLV